MTDQKQRGLSKESPKKKEIKIKSKPTEHTGLNVFLLIIPILFGVSLRYLPSLFYGNVRVYKEPVPLSIIDNFLRIVFLS